MVFQSLPSTQGPGDVFLGPTRVGEGARDGSESREVYNKGAGAESMRSFLPPYVLPFSSSVYDNFPATWRCASDWHKNHSCSYRRTKWCRLSGGHEARTLVGFTTRVACRVLCPLFSIFHLQQVSSVDPTLERLVVEPKVMGAFLSHFNDASRLHAPRPHFTPQPGSHQEQLSEHAQS
jgi:hypothetical protein